MGGSAKTEGGTAVNQTIPVAEATIDEAVLPPRVQEALGQLVGAAKEGLLALSVGVGLGVLAELMEEEVIDVVGAKGKHDAERVAVRHGHESGEVTPGRRRVRDERPRGRSEGSTENATVATALLSDLVERGLDPEQGILFVIDGAKALRKAIRNVFGYAPVQRCLRHKERNVTEHLPERERPAVKQRLRRAWALEDHARALDQLRRLAAELDRSYPGAAGSLREGMEETLTLTRLGVGGNLKRTLESNNPREPMIEIVRRTQRNVKRWSSGEMALRWTAAGMLEAERQFRKIIGYRDLATLVGAIEREHKTRRHSDAAHTPIKEPAIVLSV